MIEAEEAPGLAAVQAPSADWEARRRNCEREIGAVLARYRCAMGCRIWITGEGRIQAAPALVDAGGQNGTP